MAEGAVAAEVPAEPGQGYEHLGREGDHPPFAPVAKNRSGAAEALQVLGRRVGQGHGLVFRKFTLILHDAMEDGFEPRIQPVVEVVGRFSDQWMRKRRGFGRFRSVRKWPSVQGACRRGGRILRLDHEAIVDAGRNRGNDCKSVYRPFSDGRQCCWVRQARLATPPACPPTARHFPEGIQ